MNSYDSEPLTSLFPLPTMMHILYLIVLVALCDLGAGCSGCLRSPKGRLEAHENAIHQQESLCRELQRLGAQCEYRFGKQPRVELVLDSRWRGGTLETSILRQLSRVDEVTLEGSAVTPDVVACIVELPKLSVLSIRNAELMPDVAAALRKAKDFYGLELRDVQLDDQAWITIYELDLLWLVADSCSEVLSDDAPDPGQLGRLMSLHLGGRNVDDTTLRRAGQLRSLRQLTASRSNITDAGLSHLGTLTHLTHLNLASARVKDLLHLPSTSLQKLMELVLDDTLVTDDSLASLAGLTSLESLSLNHTEVTDRGIDHLVALQNLRTISLEGTAVTDASLEKLSQIETLLTAIDAHGDVIVIQRRWLPRARRWAAAHSKSIYLWTDQGRELVEAVATKSLSGE